MDASCAGICRIPKNGWLDGVQIPSHDFAIVVMVEHPRLPEAKNLAYDWTKSSVQATADMRACEIACCLAEYIRHMGFVARAHIVDNQLVDLERLAVVGGLVVRHNGIIESPYIGNNFSLAAVSTDYALAVDVPLRAAASQLSRDLGWPG